jgi:hypothetical protein
MAARMTGVAALAISVLAAASGDARADTPHTHDGFYLRATLGGGGVRDGLSSIKHHTWSSGAVLFTATYN